MRRGRAGVDTPGVSRLPADAPTFVDRRFETAPAVVPGSTFERCTFQGVRLQSADLSRCRFVECRFQSSNLGVARLAETVFQDVAFRDAKLVGIDWTLVARFVGASFEDCVLDQCAFVGMDLRKVPMRRCRLREAVFAEADLSEADLAGCDLTEAVFLRTKLVKADLRGARGYSIDPTTNAVKGMKASMPDAAALLLAMGVELDL
jgi:fluoroquinolone resistance protein